MKKTQKQENELEIWKEKLTRYQRKYDELRKQSPDRWWHDEHFDIQLRVFENFIAEAKKKITELEKQLRL